MKGGGSRPDKGGKLPCPPGSTAPASKIAAVERRKATRPGLGAPAEARKGGGGISGGAFRRSTPSLFSSEARAP